MSEDNNRDWWALNAVQTPDVEPVEYGYRTDVPSDVPPSGNFDISVRPSGPRLPYWPRAANFVGRQDELATLTDLVARTEGPKRVLITGDGGIGKTWLAMKWALENVNSFPDGQLLVDLDNIGTHGSLDLILTRLGVRPVPTAAGERLDLVRDVLSNKRMLVVLDGVGSLADVAELLSAMPSCTVLVTSRAVPDRANWPGLAVRRFDAANARALLEDRLGPQRLAQAPSAGADLLAVTEGLPRRLAAFARHAADHSERSLATLVADWRAQRNDPTLALDPGVLSVAVYLSDARHAARVEQALEEILAGLGGEVVSRNPPVISSWFRRMTVRFRDAGGPEALRRAVELRAVEELQAKVNAEQGDVVAKLLTALAGTPTALIQIGSLLLIKVDGVPLVRNLTPAELVYMQRNPDLARNPAACLSALQKAADRGYDNGHTNVPATRLTGTTGSSGPYGTAVP